MTIYDNEDLEAIRQQTRRFVEEKVLPEGDQWEADGRVPREVLDEMGKIGFFGLRVPEEYGGVGFGPLATVAYAEELGRSTFGGFAITALVHTELAMPYLVNFGSQEQKERWLPAMISGETLTAIAVTEPDAGSDVANLRTRAERDGEGWRLNGSKLFITNGSIADLVFVGVKTDPAVKGSRSISIVAVPKDTEGFNVSRALSKMGWHCSDTAELSFADCWVPADHLIGEENRGFYYIMTNFQNERLAISAQAIGEASKAIELTLDYVKQRKAFGKPLFDKQAIRQRLAMAASRVEAARQLIYHAAWLLEQGNDAVKEVSMVKALVGELVNDVLYECVQFHGGIGYMAETAVERMYRDVRIHSIGGGATEVMLDEVAKRL
ncbi:MAG: acyl-CoA dehydrogenase family protein [Acidimicrobiia bacterium]|nr:acyl-CoA dehydrogenase family protein [Acidimicrobiia bacterium]MDQ3499996.1 acyl-CoA dehydrogenase family protein [Actinomycetota bacterium]